MAITRKISDSNLETGRNGSKSGVSQIMQESWQPCVYSQTPFFGHLLNKDTSLLQTVCFVPGERQSLRMVPTNGEYFFPDNDYVRRVDFIRGYWNPKRKLGVTTHFSEITALQYGEKHWIGIFKKNDKKSLFPKFQSVHVNWHKCNDNCKKVSKLATNDNITTAFYTSFFEISAQLGSYQQLPLSTHLP